ncbi:MAG TPA: DoxX family protein [Capsulimonadaceae bacterium]|nr:DoxX family protein [Capsulimonadaceae bacterium]
MNDTLLPNPRRLDWALLLLRIAPGVVFLYHGSAILFGTFGGPGLSGFSNMTHLPVWVAALVGLAQFCGGLAILTGVLTRVGATCTAIVMLGAIFMVHLPHGFDVTKGGIEYALTQFLISVALIITGAGDYSVVRALPKYQHPHGTAVPQM